VPRAPEDSWLRAGSRSLAEAPSALQMTPGASYQPSSRRASGSAVVDTSQLPFGTCTTPPPPVEPLERPRETRGVVGTVVGPTASEFRVGEIEGPWCHRSGRTSSCCAGTRVHLRASWLTATEYLPCHLLRQRRFGDVPLLGVVCAAVRTASTYVFGP